MVVRDNVILRNNTLRFVGKKRYEHGWVTDIEEEQLPPGLNEDIIRAISAKKEEPEWLLEWRLKAYRKWLRLARFTAACMLAGGRAEPDGPSR